ncbi:hypothetical protein DPMN_074114 [Dreissena polymorpha]|uniref:Uncharacterized protein n=1 Tax=Dreissena polymorpha TaxID=45954 RepID=A0A9D3YH24_DREPO|nr:hypothetical protein DPMN_074114 [Dreissena polymorpha]
MALDGDFKSSSTSIVGIATVIAALARQSNFSGTRKSYSDLASLAVSSSSKAI